MMRAPILALLLLAAAASVSGRELLQSGNPSCPAKCDNANGCVRDSTQGGYRCIACQTGYVVIRATGRCGCPAGKYNTGSTCTDCPKGSYCPGGETTLESPTTTPLKFFCDAADASGGQTESSPAKATTLGTRAISKQQCVNKAGYSWNGQTLAASPCPADTYSPGLKKQPSCTPCPPGFVTSGDTKTAASDCLVPAGSYLKAPGQAALCPVGEYRVLGDTLQTSCTKCPTGVTTTAAGSDASADCTILVPGYYALTYNGDLPAQEITAARLCPANSFCPGAAPARGTGAVAAPDGYPNTAADGKIACAQGRWTKAPGSTGEADCLVPPGHSVGTDTGVAIAACDDGLYRADWKYVAVGSALACDECGIRNAVVEVDNFKSEATEPVQTFGAWTVDVDPLRSKYAEATTKVKGSKYSCYIRAGQAVYQSATGFRVATCSTNNYGVTANTYGVSAMPCRDCPTGTETIAVEDGGRVSGSKDTNTLGYTSFSACLVKLGFGYNGRIATECQIGSYSTGGTSSVPHPTCTACPYGQTTAAKASAASSACVTAAGYGTYNSKFQLCPKGTYAAQGIDTATACTECSPVGGLTYLTTKDGGSTSSTDCNVCVPGYGDSATAGADCLQQCGGSAATYGPGDVDAGTACVTCPDMTTPDNSGYAFYYGSSNNLYPSAAVAVAGASTVGDCLAKYSQVVDGVGYISTTEFAATTTQTSLELCLAQCTVAAKCMFATYNYGTQACQVYTPNAGDAETWLTGFKAVPSSNVVGAAGKQGTKGAALASGRYTMWKNNPARFANLVAKTSAADAAACMAECDMDQKCVAAAWNTATGAFVAASCKLVQADVTEATGKRSLALTVTAQLAAANAAANCAAPYTSGGSCTCTGPNAVTTSGICACASGYEPDAATGMCVDKCTADPSAYCTDAGWTSGCSAGQCTCDTGYAGLTCNACDSGYTGYPTCV